MPRQPFFHCFPGALLTDRQHMTTFEPPSCQDITSTLTEHSLHKSMFPQPRATLWLPGALDHAISLPLSVPYIKMLPQHDQGDRQRKPRREPQRGEM